MAKFRKIPLSISWLLVYSPPQPVSHPQELYVCGRTGREVQFVFIGCQASLLAHTDSTSLHFEPHVQNCILAVTFQGLFSHKCFPPLLSTFPSFSLMNSQKSSSALHKPWLHVLPL